jgi:hypothetical protein
VRGYGIILADVLGDLEVQLRGDCGYFTTRREPDCTHAEHAYGQVTGASRSRLGGRMQQSGPGTP